MEKKKPLLRFRFVIIFAILLLIAMFVLYMIQTSLEDVLDEKEKKNSTTTTVTTSQMTTTTTNDEVVYMTTTTANPEDNTQ